MLHSHPVRSAPPTSFAGPRSPAEVLHLCKYEPKPTPKDTDIALRDSLFPNDLVAAFYDALSVPSCRWMAPIKRGFAGLGNWIPELGKFLASFIFGELRLNFQCCG